MTGGGNAQDVRRLRIAAQYHQRQNHGQLDQAPPPPQAKPAVGRAETQRCPGGTDQVDDVAVLKQDRRAEAISQPRKRRGRGAGPPRPEQHPHRREG